MKAHEIIYENPQPGHTIDIEFGDLLIETEIVDVTEDGVVVHLDETAMKLILDAKRQYVAEGQIDEISPSTINKAFNQRIKNTNDLESKFLQSGNLSDRLAWRKAQKKQDRMADARYRSMPQPTPDEQEEYDNWLTSNLSNEILAATLGKNSVEYKDKSHKNLSEPAYIKRLKSSGWYENMAEGFSTDPTQPGTWNGHRIVANRKTPKGSYLILQNKNDGKYEIHRQNPRVVGGLEFMSVHKTPDEMQSAFKKLTGVDESIQDMAEAKYQGRTVQLGKRMKGDVKKFKVYVKNKKGNVIKVNFGQKGVKIKKNNPARRKSFRARHNCATAKDRTTPRYWSCRAW